MEYNMVIKEFLSAYGITEVGFCDTKSLEGYADFIMKEHSKSGNTNGHAVYLEHSYNRLNEDAMWYDPLTNFPKGKSIIVILYPYQMELPKSTSRQSQDGSKISKAALFKDYHQSVNQLLSYLRNFIMVNYDKDSKAFCDEGPLNDKAIALKTGLLKVGRNSLLLHPHYGSRFYIGYLLTELECDTPLSQTLTYETYKDLWHPFCHTCGRCQASCPNGAIEDFGHLTSQQCIAYLTQSKHWSIECSKEEQGMITVQPDGIRPNLSNYVYGCDICQMVCPLNGRSLEAYSYTPMVSEYITVKEIENLSKKEFNSRFGKTSAGWIGKKRFLRNLRWNDYVRHEEKRS